MENILNRGEQMNKSLKKHISETFSYFPCLELEPTLGDCKSVTIKGKLISQIDLDKLYLDKAMINDIPNVPEVLVVVPSNYLEKGCYVFDVNKQIKWEKIPFEHRHINKLGEFVKGVELECLCTHLIEEVKDMENPILENLITADVLFKEYERFIETGKFDIREYSHGEEGKKEYERKKQYNKFNRKK